MAYLCKAESHVACLAGLLVMSALPGAPARGEVAFFDNTAGEFEWSATCDPTICPPDKDPGTYLDVTQPTSQSGDASDLTIRQFSDVAAATPHWFIYGLGQWYLNQPDEQRIATDDEPMSLLGDGGIVEEFYFARELGPGDTVDGNLNMRQFAYLRVYNPGGPAPEVVEYVDTPTYIGVSFPIDGQTHYGWILVDTDQGLADFEPLQWAYETEPETPITIEEITIDPCPGNFNGNGTVEIDDMLSLLGAWGPCPGCPQDLDGDGDVGIADFLMLLANWGPCPLN